MDYYRLRFKVIRVTVPPRVPGFYYATYAAAVQRMENFEKAVANGTPYPSTLTRLVEYTTDAVCWHRNSGEKTSEAEFKAYPWAVVINVEPEVNEFGPVTP